MTNYAAREFWRMSMPQKRMLLAGYIAEGHKVPVMLEERDDPQPRKVELLMLARSSEEPWREGESLVVAREVEWPYRVLVYKIATIRTLERSQWSITDPRHPDYEEQQQIVRPIPVEAMAARKRRQPNRHDQT
jgi:hypothetical protein